MFSLPRHFASLERLFTGNGDYVDYCYYDLKVLKKFSQSFTCDINVGIFRLSSALNIKQRMFNISGRGGSHQSFLASNQPRQNWQSATSVWYHPRLVYWDFGIFRQDVRS